MLPGDWFDTVDIATIDRLGFVHVTYRAKDIIKSGGEWISSVAIENAVISHPDVVQAAVIAIPHEAWGERPKLIVQLVEGPATAPNDLLCFLEGRIPKWWMPAEVTIVSTLPLGPHGKVDKTPLRPPAQDPG